MSLCPLHWPDRCPLFERQACRVASAALLRVDLEYRQYWRNHRPCRRCGTYLAPGTGGKTRYHPECKPRYAVLVA